MTHSDAYGSYTLPVLDGFEDSTWHNDAMPSIRKELANGEEIRLWVNYHDKSKWEIQTPYAVSIGEYGFFNIDKEFDTLEDAVQYIKQCGHL